MRRIVVCAEDPKRYGRRARVGAGRAGARARPAPGGRRRSCAASPGSRSSSTTSGARPRPAGCASGALLAEPPRRVVINEAVCEGCGDCSTKSNCLSVLPHETEFGEQAPDPRPVVQPRLHVPRRRLPVVRHDHAQAGGAADRPRRHRTGTGPSLPAGDAAGSRTLPAFDGQYGIYFTGIGGTGVVTANRIVAAAAEAAGLVVGGHGPDRAVAEGRRGRLAPAPGAGPGRARVGHGRHRRRRPLPVRRHPAGRRRRTTSARCDPGRTVAVVDRDCHAHRGHAADRCRRRPTVADLEQADRRAGRRRPRGLRRRPSGSPRRCSPTTCSANVVLLGAAFQRGRAAALARRRSSRPSTGRGRPPTDNRAAFEWGRWAVHDPRRRRRRAGGGRRAPRTGRSIFDPSPDAQAVGAHARRATESCPTRCASCSPGAPRRWSTTRTAARAERFLDLVERGRGARRRRPRLGAHPGASPSRGSSSSPTRTSTRSPAST